MGFYSMFPLLSLRILSEHPHLLQLYKDLVITQVLTSEEFWASHAKQYTLLKPQKQDIGTIIIAET